MRSAVNFENIAGVSRIESHTGMPSIRVERDGLIGEVFLHGAHVTSWKPAGEKEDVLFLSARSQFTPDKAIRGGVPICFPWFGPRTGLPQHGFARTRSWRLENIAEESGAVVVEFSDQSDEETRKVWPFEFLATHRITFGDGLKMELRVQNSGDKPFEFEEAQHTYFRVGGIERIGITGLEGALYLPNAGGERQLQSGAIEFASEVDRAYLDTSAPVVINDGNLRRRIVVKKTNSDSTVVWNPWSAKAEAMADLGADQWQKMVCVETCNIKSNSVRLAPGESHSMTTEISVERI